MAESVTLSHRLYRWLLRAYPASFEAEYGDEMALAFRDACRREHQRRGAAGVVGQWAETVPDFVTSVVDEHSQENFQMAKTNLARLLAIAGIVGGALWVAFGVLSAMRRPGIINGPSRDLDDLGMLMGIGIGLAAVYLLGLALRQAAAWRAGARLAILVAALGAAEAVLCFVFGIEWPYWVFGYMALAVGTLLGGVLLMTQPETRPWAIPLLATGLCLLLFNSEDWRALFFAAAGIGLIALSAISLAGSLGRPSGPPVAAG